jgi:hypothetical protein
VNVILHRVQVIGMFVYIGEGPTPVAWSAFVFHLILSDVPLEASLSRLNVSWKKDPRYYRHRSA